MGLERLARWCYRRRRAVVALWIVALVTSGFLANSVGGKLSGTFTVPGAESQRAIDLLKIHFPKMAGDTASIVFKAERGVQDPQVRARMEQLFARVAKVDHVAAVQSPYQPGALSTSPGGKIAFATIQFDGNGFQIPGSVVREMQTLRAAAQMRGLQVDLGGTAVQFIEQQQIKGHQEIGLIAAIIILLLTFGSVIAMGLPIITAVFGLGIGMSLLLLATRAIPIPTVAPELASMIGVGVGIDYALFILTRYRQSLLEGQDPERAVITAITTAGRAVIFAGITVAISLLGMLVMDLSFVHGMAIATVLVVAIVVFASITLMPAILGFTGRSINRFALLGRRKERNIRETIWFRWSRLVQRHPWRFASVSLLMMLVLAIPAFSVRLGTVDAGSDPTTRSTRRAYDLLSKGFGPGFNGPLLLVAQLRDAKGVSALAHLQQRLSNTNNVLVATPALVNNAGDTAILAVYPKTSPQDSRTNELINTLRHRVIPEAMKGTKSMVMVSGITALYIDMGKSFASKLPLFILGVVGLSFLLLMAVFRSVLIPLKAALMNLLSISAAAGVIVAVFQWGWLKDVIGIDKVGPIESFLPMFLFAVLFGMSMDYEVFLLSAVREEYLRTGNNHLAVADGLAATARVITAAAAIMVTVFASFILTDARLLKMAGLGLSSAIFIDATLLRMVLAPAALELMGKANWWFPSWLDRIVPSIGIEAGDADRRQAPREFQLGTRIFEPGPLPELVGAPAVD